VLLVLGVAKLVLSGWSLSTGYFGGPLFPVIFAGTCFGLALNLAVPAIPHGVAVISDVSRRPTCVVQSLSASRRDAPISTARSRMSPE
jgi:H+/Cl- antiporter ClcA